MTNGYNVGDKVTFKSRNGKIYDGRVFGIGLNKDYDISFQVNGKERYTFSVPSTDIIGRIEEE